MDGPVRPRQLAATSIPGMCVLFQNEWDALMLETFELKKQLEQVCAVEIARICVNLWILDEAEEGHGAQDEQDEGRLDVNGRS